MWFSLVGQRSVVVCSSAWLDSGPVPPCLVVRAGHRGRSTLQFHLRRTQRRSVIGPFVSVCVCVRQSTCLFASVCPVLTHTHTHSHTAPVPYAFLSLCQFLHSLPLSPLSLSPLSLSPLSPLSLLSLLSLSPLTSPPSSLAHPSCMLTGSSPFTALNNVLSLQSPRRSTKQGGGEEGWRGEGGGVIERRWRGVRSANDDTRFR